ncbi:MAG: hypothetical protein JWL73_642 [Actinomycetia bacterium]|nr:hypothetical protein [Actinomycetes bacterium]
MTATMGGAVALRTREPNAVPWARIRREARSAAYAVVVGVGILLLVRQAPTIARGIVTIPSGNPVGLALTLLFGASTYFAAAVALKAACGRKLSLRRTTAVQVAAACTNRIAPMGLGGMATNLQYLERDGASRGEAVTAIGITSIASFVVHLTGTVAVLMMLHRSVGLPSLGVSVPMSPFALSLGAIGVTLVAALIARCLGPRIMSSIREAWSGVAGMARDRRRVALLLAGTIGVTLGHALAFAAAVAAFGVHVPILTLIAVFLAGSAIGAAAPTPGGLGAVEAALVAGLATVGVAAAPAVAGVLAFRLITYWLPIVPGAFALKILRRDALAPRDRPSRIETRRAGLGELADRDVRASGHVGDAHACSGTGGRGYTVIEGTERLAPPRSTESTMATSSSMAISEPAR